MARLPRITLPLYPHHIIQRGNNRQVLFFTDDDYRYSGILWEGRFKSAVISRDEYLILCSRYIEFNPVRAGMVTHPKDYPWSSYGFRALGSPDRLLDEDPWYVGLGATAAERQRVYQTWMESNINKKEWDDIRAATQRGRIIGKQKFQKEIEATLGRRVAGEFRGWPRKTPLARLENVL